jgi:hypothetical protein
LYAATAAPQRPRGTIAPANALGFERSEGMRKGARRMAAAGSTVGLDANAAPIAALAAAIQAAGRADPERASQRHLRATDTIR